MELCRLAVPIFFMISGFFMYREELSAEGRSFSFDKGKWRQTLARIARMILLVNIVYFAVYLLVYWIKGEFYPIITSWRFLLNLIFEGGAIVPQAWYLNNYIFALLLLYILLYRLKITDKLLLVVAVGGILLGLALGRYSAILFGPHEEFRMMLHRNALTVGLPCLIIGMFLRRYELTLCQFRWEVLAFVSLFLLLGEYYLYSSQSLFSGGDLGLLTIPTAVALFLACLRYAAIPSSSHWLVRIGRDWSMEIYLWHFLIYYLLIVFL